MCGVLVASENPLNRRATSLPVELDPSAALGPHGAPAIAAAAEQVFFKK